MNAAARMGRVAELVTADPRLRGAIVSWPHLLLVLPSARWTSSVTRVRDGHLDGDRVRIFREARLWDPRAV